MMPRDPFEPIGSSAFDYDPDAEPPPPKSWWGPLAYLAAAAATIGYLIRTEVLK